MLLEKIPKRSWIPLYALNILGQIATATKFQKLIFLIQTEGKVDGYDFHKKHYGPYSEELDIDIKAFSDSYNLIETRVVEGANHTYYQYFPTQKSIETINEAIKEVPLEIKNKVEEITRKYGNKSYQFLLEYVYKNYVINDEGFGQRFPELSDDLLSLESIWKKWYKDDCPASFLVMGIIEYQSKALFKLKQTKDPVFRGVCLSSISELTAKLVSLTSNSRISRECPLSFKSLFTEVSDQISFLSQYCGRQGIINSFFDVDFSDFMTEEELERLEKEIMQTPPSELVY